MMDSFYINNSNQLLKNSGNLRLVNKYDAIKAMARQIGQIFVDYSNVYSSLSLVEEYSSEM